MTAIGHPGRLCTHDVLSITRRRYHIDEYLVRLGEVEPYLEHTHPVHKIHVACRQCVYEQTYEANQVPTWLQPLIEKIEAIEREAKRTALLETLTEPIDLGLLDELLDVDVDPAALVGKTADWHGENFPIVQLANGRIAIQVSLLCAACNEARTTVYVGSGLHSGAFCYVFSFEGEYQANLRDQEYICETCQEKRAIRQQSTP
jgi:hypothetical protein